MSNLSFEKSKKLATNNYTINLLLDSIRKKSFIKQTFKDLLGIILCGVIGIFLAVIISLSYSKLALIMKKLAFISIMLMIFSIFILIIVFFISKNWIIETIITNVLETISLINVFVMMILFIYFAIINKMTLINSIIFYLACLLVLILFVKSVYRNYSGFYKKINDGTQKKLGIDKIDTWLRIIAKYSGLLLLIVFTFDFLKKMIVKHFSINYRSLQYVFYFFIMVPFFMYLILYFLFIYFPFKVIVPLYYFYKYQSEYEAEYHVSFGRKKRMK